VRGDRVLAEPEAARLAATLAKICECAPVTVRRPDELAAVLDDLRTFSLFGGGKITLAVDTGLFADRGEAAALIAEVRRALPFAGGPDDLAGAAREAASKLLQVLRLFDVDPAAMPAERALASLPAEIFAAPRGGKKSGGDAAEARAGMAPLLAAAVAAGLRGLGEGEAAVVADAVANGLPPQHALIFVESSVAASHPLVETLERRGAIVEAGRVAADRGGRFEGTEALAAELERETGAAIRRDALEELVRRTLRREDARRGGDAIDADSTSRFAAEYRKLATLAGRGARIEKSLVEEAVEDRGEEDVWQLLDAIGAGRAAEAMQRLERRLTGADDADAERLGFFSLLGGFARQLVAVGGLLEALRLPRGETSYPRFKSAVAPRLQGEVAGMAKNPLAGIHPFRLHRAYLAASRVPPEELDLLPWHVLECERRLKGDSGAADTALADLVLRLAGRAPRAVR
jgi:hypothetical protein